MRDNERRNNFISWLRLTTPKNNGVISLLSVSINCEQMFCHTNVCHVYNATMSTIEKWGSKSEHGKIR